MCGVLGGSISVSGASEFALLYLVCIGASGVHGVMGCGVFVVCICMCGVCEVMYRYV
jgi:hypothetical protein